MKKIGQFLLIINLIVLDAVVSYVFIQKDYFKFSQQADQERGISETLKISEKTLDTCGEECKDYIDGKISQIVADLSPTLVPSKTQVTSLASPTRAKIKSVTYLPIPGSGSVLSTNWTSVTGTDFYMSKNDYPGLVGIYFEANMKLVNGNGAAYLRLYDATHGIAVSGSEIQTSSQTSTFVASGAISLWEGYNHYVVQAKSLTADTTVFESGRLKVVTEN